MKGITIRMIKKLKPSAYIIYTVIILVGIGLDQLTKLLAVSYLKPVKDIPIWEGVFHLTYHENTGAAFGIFNEPGQRWIFMVISTVAILGLAFYLYIGRASNWVYPSAIALVVSGGIGNMIDRIALGYVVDFINFELIDFAIFNVADSFVCIGAGMLILALVLDIVKEAKSKKSAENDGDEK